MVKDRIEFLHSIDQKDKELVSTIVTFFDQFMALYTLVGSYDDIKVTNESNESVVSFNVNLSNEGNLLQLINIIRSKNNQLMVYEHLFNITLKQLDKTTLNIIFY